MPLCAWIRKRCGNKSARTRKRATCRFWSWARRERFQPAPSTRSPKSPRSRASTTCGSTWTALTAVSPPSCRMLRRISRGIALADSVAVDPHKWLYAPLEAGCALVRDRQALLDAFSYRPPYYHFSEDDAELVNYFEYGPQNSRGFRALKVWLVLRQAGREGYQRMLADDCRLSRELYRLAGEHPDLEAVTQGLSITTFRYVPRDLRPRAAESLDYLNKLNTELLTRLQADGEAFVSNAVVRGAFVLRACIVNFRTTLDDIEALPGIVARLGRQVDRELRPDAPAESQERRH